MFSNAHNADDPGAFYLRIRDVGTKRQISVDAEQRDGRETLQVIKAVDRCV